MGSFYHEMKDLLQTDAYKLSMAQAGFPLRPETFYLSFRRGGWQFVPFDLAAEISALLESPGAEREPELRYAAEHGYALSSGMLAALGREVRVRAVPAGSWVAPREPFVTVSGPSFLVSWLEPLVLRLRKSTIYGHTERFDEAELHSDYAPVGHYYAQANRVQKGVCPTSYHYAISPELSFTLESYMGSTLDYVNITAAQARRFGQALGRFFADPR